VQIGAPDLERTDHGEGICLAALGKKTIVFGHEEVLVSSLLKTFLATGQKLLWGRIGSVEMMMKVRAYSVGIVASISTE
jgi:hypothetical protein